jgi:hypothetical protein
LVAVVVDILHFTLTLSVVVIEQTPVAGEELGET